MMESSWLGVSPHCSLRSPDEIVQKVQDSVVIIQNPGSDPLSDVLALAGLRAACSVRLQAGGQWALRFRPIELKFNVVRRGECWLRIEGYPAHRLQAGDCFVISRTPFILSSDPEYEAVNASDAFEKSSSLATLGAGDDVELLGGSVSLISTGASELLSLLPPAIIIRVASGAASSFAWLLDELDKEWQSAQAGAHAMCNDLLRLIFIHALRHHINTADVADLSWLGGLREPAIASVMRAVHGAPEKPWTLAQMAEIACMSRSSFAALFKIRVGQSPVEYATRWRMQVAASRLCASRDSVATVAASLGYLSDAAFGVAFRRTHGKSPGQYRRDVHREYASSADRLDRRR
ncbi:AraC family transcriptional regulator [Pseudomonas sp. Pseu.R1]|uniref:AraC family transcriptional regulator n=1 Tax=Pseudomonas sp. Pseu.R1 TaxID=3379818 RepID=UPI003B9539C7